MFRITATRIEGEDRVEVDIVKDDANAYEIGAVAMSVDKIIEELFEHGLDKALEEADRDRKGVKQ
jgi:hypothetical protein